jgi:hypothetical protein
VKELWLSRRGERKEERAGYLVKKLPYPHNIPRVFSSCKQIIFGRRKKEGGGRRKEGSLKTGPLRSLAWEEKAWEG